MADWAIIFDVDGVLLELTPAEEELFFIPFASRCDASKLSRDWNSYRIRNDEEITAEIVERLGLPGYEKQNITTEYLSLLQEQLESKALASLPIKGTETLLKACSNFAQLGIATANFREAAELRLLSVGLWHHVSAHAFGADGGGHKREILGRALQSLELPKSNIIYIGDNINDVDAGLMNGVRFIGFSENPDRLKTLKSHGAEFLAQNHAETLKVINSFLES
jgi:phosphoglycolate phosphatase-like HAD superfamily hydrolase